MTYLVIINIAGFILYLVNTLLYRMTADGQIDAVITVVSLLGGSLGIVISILIFDGKSEKRKYDVACICCLRPSDTDNYISCGSGTLC